MREDRDASLGLRWGRTLRGWVETMRGWLEEEVVVDEDVYNSVYKDEG